MSKGGPKYCQLWTLERLLQERAVEEGDCWLWQGGMSGPSLTTPTMQFRGKIMATYAAVWLLKTGCEHVPSGMRLWRTCGEMRCISPKHIKLGTKEQMRASLTSRGAYKFSPSRKAAVTARARANPNTKLKGGMDEARQIRNSTDSEKVLAARHGISISRVNRIRNGKAWCETVLPTASIFNMGAAA